MRQVVITLAALILRRPFAAGIVSALLLMGLGLAVASRGAEWRGSAASAEEAAFAFERGVAGSGEPASDPLADFVLTDQEGRRVSLREQAGKVLLVNFVTTRCATICVQVTRELQGLQQTLGERMGREVLFLSVGLDPKADTPAALRRFAGSHGVEFRGWAFLSGAPKELRAARRAFGVLAMEASQGRAKDPHELVHTTTTYLVDRRGVLRKKIPPGFLTLTGLHEVEAALRELPRT